MKSTNNHADTGACEACGHTQSAHHAIGCKGDDISCPCIAFKPPCPECYRCGHPEHLHFRGCAVVDCTCEAFKARFEALCLECDGKGVVTCVDAHTEWTEPCPLGCPVPDKSAGEKTLPPLIVTRGDGIPLPDQAAALEEFKRQCLRGREQSVSDSVPAIPVGEVRRCRFHYEINYDNRTVELSTPTDASGPWCEWSEVSAVLEAALKELAELKAGVDAQVWFHLTMENHTLKAKLEAAQREIAELREQIEKRKRLVAHNYKTIGDEEISRDEAVEYLSDAQAANARTDRTIEAWGEAQKTIAERDKTIQQQAERIEFLTRERAIDNATAQVTIDRLQHELSEAKIGHARYEHVRRLSVMGFADLYNRSMSGMGFDALVDEGIAWIGDLPREKRE